MIRARFIVPVLSLGLVVGCGEDNEAPTGVQTTPAENTPPVPASTAGTEPAQSRAGNAAVAEEAMEFVRMATISNMFEIQSSQVILDKKIEGEEKAFAEQMITDHRKASEELMALAKSKNITVPTELDEEHKEKLEKLKGLSGEALAEEYHEMQQDAHESAVALFENASKNLQDAELKAFAAKTLPTLKSHLQKLGAHDHHH